MKIIKELILALENLLFYPSRRLEWICNNHSGLFILMGLFLNAARSLKPFSIQNRILINSYYITETIILFWFSIEFSVRTSIRYCNSLNQNILSLVFDFNPFIDIFVIFTLFFVIYHHYFVPHYSVYLTEILETLQFIQIYHFDYFLGTINVFKAVVLKHHKELFRFFILILSIFFSFSSIVYLLERDQIDSKIKNIPDSIYFTIITYMTIGYGDIVPVTLQGRILVAVSAILLVSLIIYPGTILVVGSNEVMNERELLKNENYLRHKAIYLIQSCWFLYNYNDSPYLGKLNARSQILSKEKREIYQKMNLVISDLTSNIPLSYSPSPKFNYTEISNQKSPRELLIVLRVAYYLRFMNDLRQFKEKSIEMDHNYPLKQLKKEISDLIKANTINTILIQKYISRNEERIVKIEYEMDSILDKVSKFRCFDEKI